MDPRWIIVTAANALLLFLLGQLNHALSGWSLSIYLGGLLIAYPALRMSHRTGLLAVLLSGFFAAALEPTPIAATLLPFALLHAAVSVLRTHLPRESRSVRLTTILLMNALLFSAKTVAAAFEAPGGAAWLLRAVMDGTLSSLVLVAISPWFFALQEQALSLYGLRAEEDLRRR